MNRPRGPRPGDDDVTDSNLTDQAVRQVLDAHSSSRIEREYTSNHSWWGERTQ